MWRIFLLYSYISITYTIYQVKSQKKLVFLFAKEELARSE